MTEVAGATSSNGAGADIDSQETSEWLEAHDADAAQSGEAGRRAGGKSAGDLVYFQGHSSPGNYARAYLEGRLTAEQLDGFRQEVSRPAGLSSYPHPWLMPDFWQFPTVSLGLGAITSIYQARFMRYLQARGIAETEGRKVWAFPGDGAADEQIWLLNRGGHDQQKVYAAYHEAVRHRDEPTVILAKTIKGYGMGVSGEGQMITHQAKKMTEEALLAFRDRFELPLTDEQVRNAEYYKPPEDSPEVQFLRERRASLGGSIPARRRKAEALAVPELELFQSQLDGTGEREISTTMAYVRI